MKDEKTKVRKSVTSNLGERLIAEVEKAQEMTGLSAAEIVRLVFEEHAPTAEAMAKLHFRKVRDDAAERLSKLDPRMAYPMTRESIHESQAAQRTPIQFAEEA